MKKLAQRYFRKKYAYGGTTAGDVDEGMGLQVAGAGMNAVGTGIADSILPGSGQLIKGTQQLGIGIVDAVDRPNKYGEQSYLGSLVKGNLQGGTLGMIGAMTSWNANHQRAEALKEQDRVNTLRLDNQKTANRLAVDPTATKGNLSAQYYAAGGSLDSNVANQQTAGGSATQLNSNSAEFNGPSHEEGGIQLPNMGAEVEGGETTNGDYVYSEQLGYAKLHKPIAVAIGKVEKKALSPERVNSLKLLKDKENQLKLSQEYTKQRLGLN